MKRIGFDRGTSGSTLIGIVVRLSYLALVVTGILLLATPALAMIIDGSDIKNGTVTGKDIKDGSLGQRELGFDALTPGEGLVTGRQFTSAMTVPNDRTTFTTIGQTSIGNPNDRGFVINWHIGVNNNSSTVSLMTIQVAVDGVVQEGSYRTTVPAGIADITSGGIIINGPDPGTHQIELQVQSAGAELNIGTRVLEAVGYIIIGG